MEQHKFEIEAKRMRPALLRLAMHYTEDADEAEDVIQEVLLKLWFLRDRLDAYRSVDALAIVITKHLCLNRKRNVQAETVSLEEGLTRQHISHAELFPEGNIYPYTENQSVSNKR